MVKWISFCAAFLLLASLALTAAWTKEKKLEGKSQILQPSEVVTTSIDRRKEDLIPTTSQDLAEEKVKKQTWYKNQVVILNYHHISRDKHKRFSIGPDGFAEHMAFLYENDFHPISLDEFLRFVDTGVLATENAVLITFDDGYESYYTEALPILKQYGYPSVNFVIAGRLRDTAERKRENMTMPLTVQEVKEMLASGLVAVASHTYSLHDQTDRNEWGEFKAGTEPVYLEDLARLEDEEEYRNRLYVDFTMSRVALEELVGTSIPILSLPHGYSNKIILETAKEAGYKYVFNSQPGIVKPGVPPNQIPRYNAGIREMDAAKLQQLFTSVKSKF